MGDVDTDGTKSCTNKIRIVREIPWDELLRIVNEEKAAHPEHKTTGGYFKILYESEHGQIWWNGLQEDCKQIIRSLPNFDADIFRECTGIETRNDE